MESAKATIKVNHIVYTKVINTKPVNENFPDGDWWVHFDGSRESLMFPSYAFNVGDKVKITFERV